jgi:hypothetical protein
MTRLGTCGFAFQIPEVTRMPPDNQPHLRPETETQPQLYMCQFLDHLGLDMPPPIERQNGGFHIKDEDCNRCPHYMPAGETLLIRLMRKRLRPKRKKRVAKAAPAR